MHYDLICFSHLRWNFVFQRPQHLLKRFAQTGHRVFYIEEPFFDAPGSPYHEIYTDSDSGVHIVNMHLPATGVNSSVEQQKSLLDSFIDKNEIHDFISWYYSPMAFEFSDHLAAKALVYDCMDELSAFRFAPAKLKQLETALMEKANVVFTGGVSLYEAKKHLHDNIHPFPSSIDKLHFSKARDTRQDPEDQEKIPHPRLGFFGVIDERFDTQLLEALADMRTDYHFILVGPVVKIDPATLPRRENIHYLGGKKYEELPSYLGGWNIAIMPFALNESTAFISPTKTPEFLAGGKPVISTPITDVINPYGNKELVKIASTPTEFIQHADALLVAGFDSEWLNRVDTFMKDLSWDNTWNRMVALVDKAIQKSPITSPSKKQQYV